MLEADVLDVAQPIVDETQSTIEQCRLDAGASVVTHDKDVLHSQHVHCVLENRKTV